MLIPELFHVLWVYAYVFYIYFKDYQFFSKLLLDINDFCLYYACKNSIIAIQLYLVMKSDFVLAVL